MGADLRQDQSLQKHLQKRKARVLVSILSYNSPEHTIATIQSFRQQNYADFHLQLVDNASMPGFVEQIATTFPDLEIKALKENLGYTGGNNLVLRQGLAEGYDYVIISNHDIELDENALACLLETADRCPDAGLVGGVEVCYFTGEVQLVDRGRFSCWTSRAGKLKDIPQVKEKALKVSSIQGALVLFTRRTLEAGVFLDENLFMYYDEIDIGFTLEQKGLRAYVDLRVMVRHKNKVKWFNQRSGYLQQRNRVYMVWKYGEWYHRWFYFCYASFLELPLKIFFRSFQGHADFARACLLGHIDGLKGRMGRGRGERL